MQITLQIPDENLHASSFRSAEQFSLNNERRFPLAKVVKLRSEVTKRKTQVRDVIKNMNNSISA